MLESVHRLILIPTFPTSVISQSSIKTPSKFDAFGEKPVNKIPLPAYKICSDDGLKLFG